LQNVFCRVFEFPSLRNTRKRKEKKVEEKLTPKFLSFFLENALMDMNYELFVKSAKQRNLYGVFELPLPSAPRRLKTHHKNSRKKVGCWVGGSGI
jgi:hypothetical protein